MNSKKDVKATGENRKKKEPHEAEEGHVATPEKLWLKASAGRIRKLGVTLKEGREHRLGKKILMFFRQVDNAFRGRFGSLLLARSQGAIGAYCIPFGKQSHS